MWIFCCSKKVSEYSFSIDALQIKKLSFLDCLNGVLGAKSSVWGKLYQGNLLKDTRFQPTIKFAADALFNAEVFARNAQCTLAMIQDPLYFYYMREDSIVHTISHGDSILSLSDYYIQLTDSASSNEIRAHFLVESLKCVFHIVIMRCIIPTEKRWNPIQRKE